MANRLPLVFRREEDGHVVPDIMALYATSDLDDTGETQYFGFLTADGAWMIQQYNTVVGSMRYAQGRGDYPANWTNRAGITYSLFSEVF
jgi:hypothetical protein